MKRWIKTGLSVFGLAALVIGMALFRPDTFLPHPRIVLHVPYDLNDPPTSIAPMGETIAHPKSNSPKGHPGIDFQWDHVANILSSSDGTVTEIKLTPEHFNNWDVVVTSWPYELRYKELEDYDSKIKVGAKVKAGQLIGHPEHGHANAAIQIHWEFASPSVLRDRFCPVTYFDEASRKSIEAAWAKTVWQYKAQFPDICSGDYANLVE